MNRNQKIIAFAFASLLAASIFLAPHHAEGTGEMMFRPLGTKEKIPFSRNTTEIAKIRELHDAADTNPSGQFRNLTLDQFSRQFDAVSKRNPEMFDIDFTTGFYGWPVPNYTILTGFWVVLTVFTTVGILATRDNKKEA